MIRKVMNQSNNVKLVNQVKKNGVIKIDCVTLLFKPEKYLYYRVYYYYEHQLVIYID